MTYHPGKTVDLPLFFFWVMNMTMVSVFSRVGVRMVMPMVEFVV